MPVTSPAVTSSEDPLALRGGAPGGVLRVRVGLRQCAGWARAWKRVEPVMETPDSSPGLGARGAEVRRCGR